MPKRKRSVVWAVGIKRLGVNLILCGFLHFQDEVSFFGECVVCCRWSANSSLDCRNTRPHRPEPCTTLTCASCLDVGDSSARCSAASITKPEETAVDVGGWLKS